MTLLPDALLSWSNFVPQTFFSVSARLSFFRDAILLPFYDDACPGDLWDRGSVSSSGYMRKLDDGDDDDGV